MLHDESFDLDLIGFDATELEWLQALADGEAGSDGAVVSVSPAVRKALSETRAPD